MLYLLTTQNSQVHLIKSYILCSLALVHTTSKLHPECRIKQTYKTAYISKAHSLLIHLIPYHVKLRD